jgi:hypothetical protein
LTRISRTLAIVSATLAFCLAASGQSVSLQWSASAGSKGYILDWGLGPNALNSQINVGTNTLVTLTGLTSGKTYYFAVAAYNSSGMIGPFSSEASFVAQTNSTSPPVAPGSTIVSPASGPMGTAVNIYGANLATAGSVRFNGVPASFNVVSNASLRAIVPQGATTGPLVISTASGNVTNQFSVTAVVPPPNDYFGSRQFMAGSSFFVCTDTTGATKEQGEPNHGGNSGGASVWYRWIPPFSGTYVLSTAGTQFDPLLAVYGGKSLSQLSVVASNTAPADGPLVFNAVADTAYQIAVDGFNGASGFMQLTLSPLFNSTNIFTDTFEASEGVIEGEPLAGQNGWVCAVPKLTGMEANYFPGDGQQAYLGFLATTLTSNTVLLSHPLNYTMQTNALPVIQFSVLQQIYNPLNNYHDSFGWVVRNPNGQELFDLMFNQSTGEVSFALDDGKGERASGFPFPTAGISQLIITADFARNQWSATMNGIYVTAEQPITTLQAPPALGDIDAKAIYTSLQTGVDGMFFDNFTVTAEPELDPSILAGLTNETITAGGDLVLGVVAGGAQPLSYQWCSDEGPIPGATNATLYITNVTPADTGAYVVVVGNAFGNANSSCMVTVSDPAPRPLLTCPAPMGSSGRLMNFSVGYGNSYHVQASTNLVTWTTLGSFCAGGSNATFLDSTAASYPRRFYRLVSP